MTLGDPQPLSRRQARERARSQGDDGVLVNEAIPTLDVPVLAPAALRPASFAASTSASSRRSSRHHSISESDAEAESPSIEATEPAHPNEPTAVSSAPHILSRRELRALHAREELAKPDAAPAAAAPSDSELVEAELIEPEPTQSTAAPLVEPEQMYAEPIAAEPIEPEPIVPEPVVPEPIRPHEERSSATSAWTPPIGHWSVDADTPRVDLSQPDQSLDELINRGIGAGGIPTTTNALILPSIPHQPSSASPISNTGEIMITGSFDLPRSLGSTGAHPNLFDSSEMDHMMDQLDADQLGGDSAPVSASRAVSTHASTRGMLTPPKKQRASLPMISVIATAVLAVGVLALFVIGYLSGAY
ncbi:hypothetical protein E3O25_02190 [Cryobacterium sp. TMT1-3]|uniref:Uncharacterized protein n=1 Tax=Cryobacterium luteum TaxID=1424661 RepID=A0A1H8IB66_9MICO|nr:MULTISPECIES: hypothetical protein [Cryobacterium]TFB95561.1 hypothetical protein E3O10_00525 [Cryobacterium luteum]TFC31288.1 hypothetical protein E3O25_02190 [Cryobacterium sp. TMT1-3]SEN65407.1 hypothetical protein SAMN05216281_11124 [Cryobacterium luteum]